MYKQLILYKRNSKKIYSSYGIPFECVELIRRYFILYYNLTFPSVNDAYDMFYLINSLININTNQVILLETVFSPNINDLHVGDIIFWKRNKTNNNYGHVGIIISSTKTSVVIAQQNMHNLVEKYNKNDLIQSINRKNTIFLGIKHLPRFIEFQNEIIIKKN
jgi:hypothetical protein